MPKKTKPKKTGRVSFVSVSRLFNLGNYENVKYEIGAEVAKGESPSETLAKLANTLQSFRPIKRPHALECLATTRKKKLSDRSEYEKENLAAWLAEEKVYRDACERRNQAVRDLDRFGASSTRTDHKQSWGDDDTPW